MLDGREKKALVEGCKERGDVLKVIRWGNDHCSSILNGYKQGKMGFVKAREEHVLVIEM